MSNLRFPVLKPMLTDLLAGGKSCPSGYKEIGSNKEYCHAMGPGAGMAIRSYQAACCSTDTDSMALYSQCDWAGKISTNSWPTCNAATCSKDVVAYSGDGSGDATCWGGWYYKGMADTEKNKYCCDQPANDKKWTDCEWQGMTDVSFYLCFICWPSAHDV